MSVIDVVADAIAEGMCLSGTQPLKVAVGEHFAKSQQTYVAPKNSGSKQKIYMCAGYNSGCKDEIRAYKIGTGEWRVHTAIATHNPCSGGDTTGRSGAFGKVAKQALNDNPGLQGVNHPTKRLTTACTCVRAISLIPLGILRASVSWL